MFEMSGVKIRYEKDVSNISLKFEKASFGESYNALKDDTKSEKHIIQLKMILFIT